MTKIIFSVVLASLALTTAACNTVHGAGKDLESAGGAVSDVSGQDKK